jgi:ribosomal protein S18 acetylase RimI-like enzyme
MVTLVQFRVPICLLVRFEDLLVDKNFHGRGIGKNLMHSEVNSVKESCASHIKLTSDARRTSANLFYQKLGLKLIHTNVYRLY